jgi:hypothetical protein
MGVDPETNGAKLPVHQYVGAVAEVVRGNMTQNQLAASFNLAPDEITDTQSIVSDVTSAALTRAEVHDVLLCAERFLLPYNTVAAVETRLGL